jgi:hypothetical protein
MQNHHNGKPTSFLHLVHLALHTSLRVTLYIITALVHAGMIVAVVVCLDVSITMNHHVLAALYWASLIAI